jgi:hypothetical protein
MTTNSTQNPDTAILEAAQRIKSAHADMAGMIQLPDPEAAAFWNMIDADEQLIASVIATTPQGVAAQVWASLSHGLTDRRHNAAADRHDLAYFTPEVERDLDWSDNLLLAALRSLTAMEG